MTLRAGIPVPVWFNALILLTRKQVLRAGCLPRKKQSPHQGDTNPGQHILLPPAPHLAKEVTSLGGEMPSAGKNSTPRKSLHLPQGGPEEGPLDPAGNRSEEVLSGDEAGAPSAFAVELLRPGLSRPAVSGKRASPAAEFSTAEQAEPRAGACEPAHSSRRCT